MSRTLTVSELLRCKYEGIEKGWTLDEKTLPDSIETEIGLLEYMMGNGYVIIPKMENGDLLYNDMMRLTDFLEKRGVEYRTEEVIKLLKIYKEKEELDKEKHKNWEKERTEEGKRLLKMFDAPDGFFVCWECGRTRPNEEMHRDGTCGC